MKRYVPLTTTLESIIEFFIMQHLRADNVHIDDELVYNHKIVIHSVEILDDNLLIANVEHSYFDELLDRYCQPKFTKIELTPIWPAETVFNIEVES